MFNRRVQLRNTKRRRPNEYYSNTNIELDYGWKTDGYMIAVLFKRETVERTNRIKQTDRVVGIDPGLHDIFLMADGSSEDIKNKKTVKERSVKFSNNEVRSSFGWPKQVELKNRASAGMQVVYNEISSLDNGDSNTILNYLQVLSKNCKKVFCFMKGYRQREATGYLYSNRQVADDYMCQLVLAKTSSGAPCVLAHKTKTQKRQKARRAFKKSNQAGEADDGRRTVVAYGGASLSGMKKGHTPIPVKVY
ncbi:hypothetical protein G6F70_005214 [Rhizopus microsporus]|nr:hypothetical protein G6F71_006524 [Rhizopus microsporus]KAG1199104.1 hypothetical protein G6F70_005214 [Rhizopus microsporus]KAG1262976.1 hypothetical protein G6F68_005513 [Rhizopus microsporus]